MNILHLLLGDDDYDVIAATIDLSRQLGEENYHCKIVSLEDLSKRSYGTTGVENEFLASSLGGPWPFRYYALVERIIKREKIDIIHTHSPFTSWVALCMKRRYGIAFVATCHHFYCRSMYSRALFYGKAAIVHQQAIGQHCIDVFGCESQQLHFIKQGIDLKRFEYRSLHTRSKTDFSVVLSQPLQRSTGYEEFFKAMVKVLRIIPHVKILLPDYAKKSLQGYKKDMELFIRRLGIYNNVEFFDASCCDFSIVRESSLFISPCTKEVSRTRCLLEALAYGVPIAATRVAGTAEMIRDKQTGILLPVNDFQAWTKEIIELLRDSRRSSAFAAFGRQQVEKEHDIKATARMYGHIYRQAQTKQRIGIINLGLVQESFWSLFVLNILRSSLKNTKLVNIVDVNSRFLFLRSCASDELHAIDFRRKIGGILTLVRIMRILIRQRCDCVIDFTNSPITRWSVFLSFTHKQRPTIIGKGQQAQKNILQNDSKNIYGPLRYRLAAIRPYVGDVAYENNLCLPLEEDDLFVDQFFQEHWIGKTKIAGVDISSTRSSLRSKAAVDSFAYLCDLMANNDMRVIVMGLGMRNDERSALIKRTRSKPIFANENIDAVQFLTLLKRCSIYVTADYALSCLARSYNIPSILLTSVKKSSRLKTEEDAASLTAVISTGDIQKAQCARSRKRWRNRVSSRSHIAATINRLIKTQ